MKEGKIAVIGDSEIVEMFKAIGMDIFPINNNEEAVVKLKEIEKDYSVIYITENYAIELDDLLKKYEQRTYPIIVPIPSATSNTGYGINKIRDNVEKAVGMNILDD